MSRVTGTNLDNMNHAEVEELAKHTTVTVERPFYEKLIDIVAKQFSDTHFLAIKSDLIIAMEESKDISELVTLAEAFVEERKFIELVLQEKDTINSLKD
jgi:hypothetical protein